MKRGFLNKTRKPLYTDLSIESGTTASGATAALSAEPERPLYKLPYGKVEKIAPLPENYKSPERIYQEIRPGATNVDEGTVVCTIVPPRNMKGPSDPDGHSMWIVLGPTKKKLLDTPGYPSAIPKPKGSSPSYAIRSTPNMGLGLFATKNIKVGELIFSERPLLVMSMNISIYQPSNLLEGMDRATFGTVVMAEAEKTLEMVVARMDPENRDAFMALANNHTEDGSGPLLGIARTNGYGIPKLYDGPKQTASNLYSGTCKIGSRINHSCMPNVTHDFSLASFSFQFKALRDIEAGEQLFFTYVDLNIPAAARGALLAPYGITKCVCAACTNATPETDKLHQEYEQRIKEYQAMNTRMVKSPAPINESVLEPILEFQKALITEGLHATNEYPALLGVLSNLNSKLGRRDKARMYMDEMLAYMH